MDAGSYSKEIIDIVDKNSQLFYIRANKSTTVFEQIKAVENWQEIELNYKKYEVTSIPFKQYYQKRHFRLVILREKANSTQVDLFTKDTMK
jgi:hypothetical protein